MSSPVVSDGIIVKVGARTDVGMRRQGNEDSFLVADLSTGRLGLSPEVATHQVGSNGSLLIVSDGLGGAAAGEVASSMAVQTICTELMKSAKSVLSPSDRLKRCTELANDKIWQCSQSDASLRGMGATVTAAYIHGSTVYIAQVGDSRAYIIRNGKVKQVTEDQSWANAVKKAGLETKDVPSNVILQALGTQPKVHVEVTSVDLVGNDGLLLCSDGLSNKVKDEEMCAIVSKAVDLDSACQQLVDLANKRGGEDNITVVIAKFSGEKLNIGLEKEPSITSSFKVVAPLDFSESMDETMSFREEVLGNAGPILSESVPTLSDLPQLSDIPVFSEPAKVTAPLSSPPKPEEPKSPVQPPVTKPSQTEAKTPLVQTPVGKAPTPPLPPTDLFGKPAASSPPPVPPAPKTAGSAAPPQGVKTTPPQAPVGKPPAPTQEVKAKPETSFADLFADKASVQPPVTKPLQAEAKTPLVQTPVGKAPAPPLPPADLFGKPAASPLPPVPPAPKTAGSAAPPQAPVGKPPAPTQEVKAKPETSFADLFADEGPPAQKASPPAPIAPIPKPGMQLKSPDGFNFESSLFGTKPEEVKAPPQELFAAPPPPPAPNQPNTSPLFFSAADLANATPATPPPKTAEAEKHVTLGTEPPSQKKVESTPPPQIPVPTAKASPTDDQLPNSSLFGGPAPAKPEVPLTPSSTKKLSGPEVLASIFSAPAQQSKPELPKPVPPPPAKPVQAAVPPPPPPAPPKTAPLPEAAKSPEPPATKPGFLFISEEQKPEPPRLDPFKSLPIFSAPPPPTKSPLPPLTVPANAAVPSTPTKPELPKVEMPAKQPVKETPKPLPPVVAPPPPVEAKAPAKPETKVEVERAVPLKGLNLPEVSRTPERLNKTLGKEKNVKMMLGIGGAVVLVLVVGFVIISNFTSGSEVSQPVKPPVTEQPTTPPAPNNTPAQQSPTNVVVQNSIPADTKGRINYALEEINKTIDRVESVMPDSDPLKQSRLSQLNAFKETLEDYNKKGIFTEDARGYADAAISQLTRLNAQLDQLPPPEKGRKKRKK